MERKKKKFEIFAIAAILVSLCLMGGVSCSSGSSDDDIATIDDDICTIIIKDFSLSDIKTTLPGVPVADSSKFSALSESNTVTVTITCNSWDTIDNGESSWFQCNFDDKNSDNWNSLIKLEDWNSPNVSTTITGDKITALQNGGLYIVGNNKNATVTVSYK